MQHLQRSVIVALERACSATRAVEWLPGCQRFYPQCLFARWSANLDRRWDLGIWPPQDYDGWAEWFDALPEPELRRGHWHVI